MTDLVCGSCNCLARREFFQMSDRQRDKDSVSKIVILANNCKEGETAYWFEMIFQNKQTSLDPLQFFGIVLQDKQLLEMSRSILLSDNARKILLNPLVKRLSEVAEIIQRTYLLSFVACWRLDATLVILFNRQDWEGCVDLVVGKGISVSFNEEPAFKNITNLAVTYFSLPTDKRLTEAVMDFLDLLNKDNVVNLYFGSPYAKKILGNIISMNPFDFLSIVLLSGFDRDILLYFMQLGLKRRSFLYPLGKSLDRLSNKGVSEFYLLSFVHCLGNGSIDKLLNEYFRNREWDYFVSYFIFGRFIPVKY